jgi:effector-binding domain-containing protein
MHYQITTLETPEQRVLAIRSRVPQQDMPTVIGSAFAEIYGYLADLEVEPAGEPAVLYHSFGPEFDTEIVVPVAREIPVTGRLVADVLPAATVAQTIHVGPYEKLGEAYEALRKWMEHQGFAPAGPVREHYETGVADGLPPEQYRTRIEMPIVEVAALALV